MNKNKVGTCLFIGGFFLSCWQTAIANVSEMIPLEDNDLRQVAGQGLILNDKISGSELVGANAYSEPFDFYRMGLNGELEMNMNISKLQLGCGGINDHLSGFAGCDIDIDYASLMGRNGTEPGASGSPFKLTRPYRHAERSGRDKDRGGVCRRGHGCRSKVHPEWRDQSGKYCVCWKL